MVDERSLLPMNLSTARNSSRGLVVKSCEPSVRPAVVTTAAMSLLPMYFSMNWRAACLVRFERIGLVCRSSSTIK